MTRRIAVILGGRSSENAISQASAKSVIDALEASGHDVLTVAIDREGRWQLDGGPKQLEAEMLQDAWIVLPASGAIIFDTPVHELWERLAPPTLPEPSLN